MQNHHAMSTHLGDETCRGRVDSRLERSDAWMNGAEWVWCHADVRRRVTARSEVALAKLAIIGLLGMASWASVVGAVTVVVAV